MKEATPRPEGRRPQTWKLCDGKERVNVARLATAGYGPHALQRVSLPEAFLCRTSPSADRSNGPPSRIAPMDASTLALTMATCEKHCTMPELDCGVGWSIRPKRSGDIPE